MCMKLYPPARKISGEDSKDHSIPKNQFHADEDTVQTEMMKSVHKT